MNNTKAAVNEHWEGIDQLHRIVAALLVLALAWTWWLGHPRADRPGWCQGTAACGVGAAAPLVAVPPVVTPTVAQATMAAPAAAAPPAPALQADTAAPAPAVVPQAARVFFTVNDSQLPSQAAAALAETIAYLKAEPTARASIVGFHDPSGNTAANEALAKTRAESVSTALLAAGVAASQLSLDKPMVTTGSGTAAEARRVEVSIKP
jgi:outer membrane protein OmpA-like peptidoglycan-associated protein